MVSWWELAHHRTLLINTVEIKKNNHFSSNLPKKRNSRRPFPVECNARLAAFCYIIWPLYSVFDRRVSEATGARMPACLLAAFIKILFISRWLLNRNDVYANWWAYLGMALVNEFFKFVGHVCQCCFCLVRCGSGEMVNVIVKYSDLKSKLCCFCCCFMVWKPDVYLDL